MQIRTVLKYLLFFAITTQYVTAQTKHQQPNVVFILADDQGWGDIASHGNQLIETPVLDQLAVSGARFDRFFVTPLCAPTRAGLLTGRYHLRTGVASVTSGLETMRSEETTLAEAFRAAGYKTGAFGKWHNGAHYPEHPNGQGFEEFFGFCGGHWTNYFNTSLEHNGKTEETKGFITDVLTDHALQFVKANKDRPFFCYLPYNAPHGPFQVPDAYFDKYTKKGISDKDAAVYGMVENMDKNIGRILKALDSMKLTENTIVVFCTDNGPNGKRYNANMKGTKGSVDEGGVRVPLFIRYPGKIKQGQMVKQIAAYVDLFPTLMELCGIKAKAALPLDGKSLLPLLQNPEAVWPERMLFTHVMGGGLREGLKPYPGAVRTSQYRLVVETERTRLYDMLKDPEQSEDIAEKLPSVREKLKAHYTAWFEEVTKKGIQPEVTKIGCKQAPIVELYAPDAKAEGSLKYFAKNGYVHDWFTGWTQSQDAAVWTIDVVDDGYYEVLLKYNCSPALSNSKMQVDISGKTLTSTISTAFEGSLYPSPDRVERIEAFEKDWALLSLGKIKITKGRKKLYVRKPGTGSSQPFELKSVIIKQ